MTAELSFDAKGFVKLAREIRAMGRQLSNMRPTLQRLLPLIVDDIGQNIRTEGRNIREQYDPIQSDTIRRRGRGRPLQVSRSMLRDLESPARMRRRLTRNTLVVGPTERLPFIHHFGSRKRNIPARKIVLMSDRMVERADKAIAARVDLVLRGR